jgi:hypothetical protein
MLQSQSDASDPQLAAKPRPLLPPDVLQSNRSYTDKLAVTSDDLQLCSHSWSCRYISVRRQLFGAVLFEVAHKL